MAGAQSDGVRFMAGEALEVCPICRYSLRGLPAAHRCPECGFGYDEYTKVFISVKPWRTFARLFFSIAVFGLFALAQFGHGGPGRPVFVVILIFSLGLILWSYPSYWRSQRAGRFVALHPEGVTMRGTDNVVTTIQWAEAHVFESLRPPRRSMPDVGEHTQLAGNLQDVIGAGAARTAPFWAAFDAAKARYAEAERCATSDEDKAG
jgi:hypothetical protein